MPSSGPSPGRFPIDAPTARGGRLRPLVFALGWCLVSAVAGCSGGDAADDRGAAPTGEPGTRAAGAPPAEAEPEEAEPREAWPGTVLATGAAETASPAGADRAPGPAGEAAAGEAAARPEGGPPAAPGPDSGTSDRGSATPGEGTRSGQAGPRVAELLERAERAYRALSSLRARFRQTIEVPLMDRRREGHGIWYQRGRGHFRMDFVEPPEDEIVADGTHLWLYYPSTNPKQVIKTSLDEGGTEAGTADVLARILEEARTAYEGSYAGREGVSGVEAHLVSLRPRDPRSPYLGVRVWIGVEDQLVRRFEITEANETVRTVTLADLEPNAPIPPETFRFEPPTDADVFER